jgi:transcriptional regulator with XRE-family HTH domain
LTVTELCIRALDMRGESWSDFTTVSEFGRFVKDVRESKGLSLREFCRLADLDPANWSKVERGIFPPPKSRDCVADIATVLLLEKGSAEWDRLFELAAVGHIPAGLLAEPSVGEKITVFFRLDGGGKAAADRAAFMAANTSGPKRADAPRIDALKADLRPRDARASRSIASKAVKRILKPGSIRSGGGSREKKR